MTQEQAAPTAAAAAAAAAIQPEDQEEQQSTHFFPRAIFRGHNAAIEDIDINQEQNVLVSTSRDKTALVWKLRRQEGAWAEQYTRLRGHNHFVSGASLSLDASHLLTSSWDGTLRLWDLTARSTKELFLSHSADVLGVTFSPDNRRIISVSRDKTVKIWNILGDCKATLEGDSWATSVACAPMNDESAPLIIAVGYWNGSVSVWKIADTCEKTTTIQAHEGRCSAVSFTPDGKWFITAGSDRKVSMWMTEGGAKTLTFTTTAAVTDIAPCPTQAWICAATYDGIHVWDIQAKSLIDNVRPNFKPKGKRPDSSRFPDCTCLAWASDGSVLYAGYNDGNIRAW